MEKEKIIACDLASVADSLKKVIDSYRAGDEIVVLYRPHGHKPEITEGENTLLVASVSQHTLAGFIPKIVNAGKFTAHDVMEILLDDKIKSALMNLGMDLGIKDGGHQDEK